MLTKAMMLAVTALQVALSNPVSLDGDTQVVESSRHGITREVLAVPPALPVPEVRKVYAMIEQEICSSPSPACQVERAALLSRRLASLSDVLKLLPDVPSNCVAMMGLSSSAFYFRTQGMSRATAIRSLAAIPELKSRLLAKELIDLPGAGRRRRLFQRCIRSCTSAVWLERFFIPSGLMNSMVC